MTQLTYHAIDRMDERMGLSKSAATRIAAKALLNGLTHAEATGKLKTLITALFLRYKKGNNIRVFSEKIFVFHDDRLITVLPLHREYRSLANKLLRRKRGES